MGGSRATSDLAQGLGTTFAAAERMKILHGAVGLSEVGALDMIERPARTGRTAGGAPVQPGGNRPGPASADRGNPRIDGLDGCRRLRRRGVRCRDGSFSRVARSSCLFARAGRGRFPRSGASRQACKRQGIGRDVQFPAFAAAAGLLRWELMGGPDPFARKHRPDRCGSRRQPGQTGVRMGSGKFLNCSGS